MVIGIKDNLCRKDSLVGLGLKEDLLMYPSSYNSQVVRLLKDHQIVINDLTPFACGTLAPVMDSDGLYLGASSHGTVRDLKAGLMEVGVATDTGGSSIVPAARARFFAFKPTYGRISRRGLVPLCNFLDHVAIVGKGKETLKSVFALLDVHDPQDCTSLKPEKRPNLELKPFAVVKNMFPPEDLHILKGIFKGPIEQVSLQLPPNDVLEGLYYYCICPQLYSNLRKFNGFHNKNLTDLRLYHPREKNLSLQVFSRVLTGRRIKFDLKKVIKMRIYLNNILNDQRTWIVPAAVNLYKNENHSTPLSGVFNLLRRPIYTFPTSLSNGLQVVGSCHTDLALLNLLDSKLLGVSYKETPG